MYSPPRMWYFPFVLKVASGDKVLLVPCASSFLGAPFLCAQHTVLSEKVSGTNVWQVGGKEAGPVPPRQKKKNKMFF